MQEWIICLEECLPDFGINLDRENIEKLAKVMKENASCISDMGYEMRGGSSTKQEPDYKSMSKVIPLNCSKCGRFVGKDGFHDVSYDYWNGGYDVGYPLCKKCLDRSNTKNTEQANQPDSTKE